MCVCVQVRHYSPTRWVSTDAEAYFMGVGAAMAFRRLFQYITGANEGGEDHRTAYTCNFEALERYLSTCTMNLDFTWMCVCV